MPDDSRVKTAMDRFQLSAEAFSEIRESSLDDVNFSLGQQWPTTVLVDRNRDNRIALTMDHTGQYLKQISNEQRQQRPAAQINPVGNNADNETAEVIQGIVRHIEVNSEADIADDMAFDQMLRGGFGFERIITQYVRDVDDTDVEDDEQEIYIEPIENQFTVYIDPAARFSKLFSDARFMFIVQDIPFDDYKADYGDSELAGYSEEQLSSIGDQCPGWVQSDKGVAMVRVAEYFYVETKKVGKKQKRQVKWALMNAVEFLEERDWPGKYIPIVPILGEAVEVEGKLHLSGLIRKLKDPQRMYNYWCSCATETIALAPKAPWVAAAGQIEDFKAQWEQANIRNISVLPYTPISVSGTVVAAPMRQTFEPAIQSFIHMLALSDNDMKASVGIYDASLGEKGPDQSGKAILARQKQADVANLNWSDNLARSIKLRTKMLIDLIPKIYPPAKVQRIVNPDQTSKMVGIINSKTASAKDREWIQQQEGIKKIYDIGVGEYDETVSVGPTFQTKRQEAVASQLEFLKLLPPQAGVNFLDLITGNMDWPQAREFAARAKKMLPPQLQDDGEDGDPEAKLQQLQAQMQHAGQQIDLLSRSLNDAHEVITQKQIENQTKLEVTKLQEQTKVLVAEITTKAQEVQTRMEMEKEVWAEMHGSAHDVALQAHQQGHEADMQAQQQDAAAQSQDAQQGHEAQMAQQAQEAQPSA